MMKLRHVAALGIAAVFALSSTGAWGQEAPADAAKDKNSRPKRLLLLSQGPDGHPWSTHEYVAGAQILAKCLQPIEGLQTILVKADEPWKEGPELLDGADGVVVFLSEGARWVNQDRVRLQALQKLAERGGGLVCLHWGMGTREADNIEPFLKLFGGCHGGPDRQYKILDARTEIAAPKHPIVRGIGPVDVHEEFYYQLKFIKPDTGLTPLVQVPIDGQSHTVGWAWERPDGGRSFGFSGFHFHKNWEHVEYRRLAAQAVLWTLKLPIPEGGLPVEVTREDLTLSPRPER
jgi:type 1 glutamine amidotransferase